MRDKSRRNGDVRIVCVVMMAAGQCSGAIYCAMPDGGTVPLSARAINRAATEMCGLFAL
jgi:hypothetical protein